ncbi:MAG: TolC family protein, partial [Chitinophagales bacterium]
MSIKKQEMFWLFAFLLILSNHPAKAQQDKWDLRRCVEYAFNNNISIKQADIDARVAKLSYEQSKWSQFGQASFATSMGLNFGRSINPTTNLFTTNQSLYQNYSLQAGASLFNWFSLRRTIEANKYSYDAQLANVDKVKSDVALNVAAAYLTALLAREQVNVSSSKLQLTRQQLDITRRMVDAGSVPELNAAELEAQFATDTSTFISAKETYGINLLQLKALLSLDAAVPFDLDNTPVESIPLEPIGELQPDLVYSLAEKSYPVQKMNDLRLAAAQKTVGAYKGQLFPTLSIFGGLGNSFNNELRQQIITQQPDQATNLYAVNNAFDTSIVYSPSATQNFVSQPFSKV